MQSPLRVSGDSRWSRLGAVTWQKLQVTGHKFCSPGPSPIWVTRPEAGRALRTARPGQPAPGQMGSVLGPALAWPATLAGVAWCRGVGTTARLRGGPGVPCLQQAPRGRQGRSETLSHALRPGALPPGRGPHPLRLVWAAGRLPSPVWAAPFPGQELCGMSPSPEASRTPVGGMERTWAGAPFQRSAELSPHAGSDPLPVVTLPAIPARPACVTPTRGALNALLLRPRSCLDHGDQWWAGSQGTDQLCVLQGRRWQPLGRVSRWRFLSARWLRDGVVRGKAGRRGHADPPRHTPADGSRPWACLPAVGPC